MKRILLLACFILAMGNIGIANAESANKAVSPKLTPHSGGMTSGAVSESAKDAVQGAKDAMSKTGQKSDDVKDSDANKMKKEAEDALKMKKGMK
ncbi:MAG: hypothetical protein HOJ06_08080 [Rhodospirillaceae bacterium]|jgi:hypothetical protein|nr:hypothetical protein [Rhodospirillaceae bacterium]